MPSSPIDFKKQLMEIVFVNMPGPTESEPGMTGGELLHGFLAEVYNSPETHDYVTKLCSKWNVVYREKRD